MGKLPFTNGDRVSKYIIEGTFSVGGMGVVYKVKGDDVLIKTPFSDAEPTIIDQFQEEVEALKKLSHSGIVKIVDAGFHNGVPWYSMERLKGETLRDLLKRENKLSCTDALRIEYQIVLAMAYAHSRDKPVLHRDLKPDNICFQNGIPVILDFGLARFGTDSSVILSPHGTLLYMAPEQIRGRTSARTDVYALGVIFYEMLCAKPPFVGHEKDSDTSVVEQILDLNIPAPKLAHADESIAAICEKALNKRSEFRYADATEMVGDIKFALRKQLKIDAIKQEQQKNYKAASALLREAVEYGLPMSELEEFWKFRIGRSLKVVLIDQSSIESSKKALTLKKLPYIVPILEVIEGHLPYLVVEALTSDPLTKRISQGCYLSFRECVFLCQAVKNTLEAAKQIDLAFPIEERRIFPGNDFRIAGLHRARIGYREIPAARFAAILVRGLSGTLNPDWDDFPDVFSDILKRALEDPQSGDAISLAKSIEEAWENQERQLEEIRKIKERLLANTENLDAESLKTIANLFLYDRRETVRAHSKQTLEEIFIDGAPDGDWENFAKSLIERPYHKTTKITKRVGKFLGTIFHKGEEEKEPDIKNFPEEKTFYSSELIDFFESANPNPSQLTPREIKKLFEEFCLTQQKETTRRLKEEHTKLLRTIVQKDDIISELKREKERLLNLVEEERDLNRQNEMLIKELKEKYERVLAYSQSVPATRESSPITEESAPTIRESTPTTSSTTSTSLPTGSYDISKESWKYIKRNLVWLLGVMVNGCEQILSHLGGQRSQLTLKEKQIEKAIQEILSDITKLKLKMKEVKSLPQEEMFTTAISYLGLTEKLRLKLVDMIKKESISRHYGTIHITL